MPQHGSRWSAHTSVRRGADYDKRWADMEASGHSIHGEADFICRFNPSSVLDAGCGTGRVAIELASRGIDVVGVDLDPPMLTEARSKAPDHKWVEGDLARLDLERKFDLVAMPGNVMIFVQPGTESVVVSNMAQHLNPGGLLIAGFQLGRDYDIDRYDTDCELAGLAKVDRFSNWGGDEWNTSCDYAVSVHGC